MSAVLKRRPLYRRPEEIGRRVVASVVEFGVKAYGVAAAVSVALSDAETVGGKAYDAVNAVPNLMERYDQAKYVVDHQEEYRAALDYVHDHGPDPRQLETAVQKSTQTLESLTTTYSEVTLAWGTFTSIRPNNVLERLPRAKEHFDKAWAAKPDVDSIQRLADEADGVALFLRQLDLLDIDFRGLYADLLSVMDNFASDEIAATLGVMGAAFALAWCLGMAVGFWGRRGRPGLIAGILQRRGTHHFRDWYVGNLEYAMGRPLYVVARERIQSDIVANPDEALDPEALETLERYFELRLREKTTASSEAVTAP